MTGQKPDSIEVRDGADHVEVVGLSAEDVQSAIDLFCAVDDLKLHARAALEDYLNQALIDSGTELTKRKIGRVEPPA